MREDDGQLPPNTFEGDFSPCGASDSNPLWHMTWDWWWWLVMIDDPKVPNGNNSWCWSTNALGQRHPLETKWAPGVDEDGGMIIDGMVCAWWFDNSMHGLHKRTSDMVAMSDTPSWPGDGNGNGGGAIVPLLPDDLSMGLSSDKGSFWLNLVGDKIPVENGAPASMALNLTPWNPAMSMARPSNATYAAGMGYDILRVHGTKVNGPLTAKR